MDATIDHRPSFALVTVDLEAGEAVRAEAGAMVSHDDGIAVETGASGGLLGSLKRSVLGGESFFQNTFTAETAGSVSLAPPLPGDVVREDLADETLYVQSGSYLASAPDIDLDTEFGGAKTFFGSEGLFLLSLTGTGPAFLASYGAIEARELEAGERFTVDTGHIVAFEASATFDVRRVGGLKSTLFSGRGSSVISRDPDACGSSPGARTPSCRGSSPSSRASGRGTERAMACGGIDLGATNLRAAVADADGEPLTVERRETPRDTDGTAVARTVARTLEAAAGSAGVDVAALEAVGVGTIGPLDRSDGTVIRPPNLPGVDRIPLMDVLIALIGHPRVYVENDAVAGLVGERAATGEPPTNLVYLTLSTGIGAGVAVDGHVLRGRAGNAAEVGHLVVEPDGRPCGCGGSGHWEAYCSGGAIPAFARDLADRAGVETTLPLEAGAFSAADVFDAAGEDPLADRVVAAVQRYNAIGVADLIHAYAPDRLAVGGAVALENPSVIVDPLADAVEAQTMLSVPAIEPAAHGHDAVLRGALALAAEGGLEAS